MTYAITRNHVLRGLQSAEKNSGECLLSYTEAGSRIGVCGKVIKRLVIEGKLRRVALNQRVIRVPKSDVDALIEAAINA